MKWVGEGKEEETVDTEDLDCTKVERVNSIDSIQMKMVTPNKKA